MRSVEVSANTPGGHQAAVRPKEGKQEQLETPERHLRCTRTLKH